MGSAHCLAIEGGDPAVTCGPFPWPIADEAVRESLEAAYRDGDWGRYHGVRCTQLREALAVMHHVEHAHLCSSGTVGVELALRAVGVEPGDGVLLAAYDFPGNFRAVEAVGAVPVLVDIDPRTWSMDVAGLAEHAQAASDHSVRAVLVSHLHGGLVDMTALRDLASKYGWRVVEDACQATGATLQGRSAGAWGDAGVLSFGGSKLLTAGRGGAVLTDDAMVAQRLKILNGRGNDAYPLSELQAAVLLPQLEALEARHAVREKAASDLRSRTRQHTGCLFPIETQSNASHAYYKFAWRLAGTDAQEASADETRRIAAILQAEGAPVDVGFRGFVTRSERRCRRLGKLQSAKNAASQTLLMHHPALLAGEQAIEQIAASFAKLFETR